MIAVGPAGTPIVGVGGRQVPSVGSGEGGGGRGRGGRQLKRLKNGKNSQVTGENAGVIGARLHAERVSPLTIILIAARLGFN